MSASTAAQRLRHFGAEGLTDAELLDLVVGTSPPGTPGQLRTMGLAELRGLGLSDKQALQVKAALELGRRAVAPPAVGMRVRCPADIAQVAQAELAGQEQEMMLVFGLDARHRVRLQRMVALGQVDRVQVAVADVFRPLVREAVAAAIVAHNHPSGEANPSPQDETLTLRLYQAGLMLGITLIDHLVVTRGGYYSFADQGLLAPSPSAKLAGEARTRYGRT